MIWIITSMVCTGVAGYHYGKLVGINLMLSLGQEVYPGFKNKIVNYMMTKESE
jgi:hypothetical protein